MTVGPADLLENLDRQCHLVRIYTPHHLKTGPTRMVFATAAEAEAEARYAEMENDPDIHTGAEPRIRKIELVVDNKIIDRTVQLHDPMTMR
jgi:hypothetical protein